MRVVFMGTPAFAVPSLEALAAAHDVILVVSAPDRVAGRGTAATPTAVKSAASDLDLQVMQPDRLGGQPTATIAALTPDVICVAAFGMLLPADLLAVPPCGCINVHASLLPRYRGAAPIQRAILAGERETGISIMRMESGLDTGPYALQRAVTITDRYAEDIEAELAILGAGALIDVLQAVESGQVRWTAQDDSEATYAQKITKDDVALRPELSTAEAFARIRAATRRAPARACAGEREITVVRAHPVAMRQAPGVMCTHEGDPALGFEDGSLVLDVVRPAGKGDMAGRDWARGARLSTGTCWRCTR